MAPMPGRIPQKKADEDRAHHGNTCVRAVPPCSGTRRPFSARSYEPFRAPFFSACTKISETAKKPRMVGNEMDAGEQIRHIEIVAFDTADRIEADHRYHQTNQYRQPALPECLGADRCRNREAEEYQRENFRRAEGGNRPVGDRRGRLPS